MRPFARLLERLVPALLLAGGVTLLVAGLLSLAPPSLGDAQPPAGPGTAGNPALSPVPDPPPPSRTPLPTPLPSFEPYRPASSPRADGPAPSVEPSPPPAVPVAYATRVVVPSLRIDLPIVPGDLDVPGNRNSYPLCDVAQYLMELGQPGQPGTAYIYAHAQRGMFLPMLRASRRNDGEEMLGALVEVYTSDATLHLYEIFRVKRHATDLSLALDLEPNEQRLILQTSEGPEGVIPKLQVAARPIGQVPSTLDEAMPEPAPRACPPP